MNKCTVTQIFLSIGFAMDRLELAYHRKNNLKQFHSLLRLLEVYAFEKEFVAAFYDSQDWKECWKKYLEYNKGNQLLMEFYYQEEIRNEVPYLKFMSCIILSGQHLFLVI